MSIQDENFAFWSELWQFVTSIQEPILPVKMVSDIYELGKNIYNNPTNDWVNKNDGWDFHADLYMALCWNCCDLARSIKQRLPDNLHARMVLGEQNEKTKKYVKWCEKNDL